MIVSLSACSHTTSQSLDDGFASDQEPGATELRADELISATTLQRKSIRPYVGMTIADARSVFAFDNDTVTFNGYPVQICGTDGQGHRYHLTFSPVTRTVESWSYFELQDNMLQDRDSYRPNPPLPKF